MARDRYGYRRDRNRKKGRGGLVLVLLILAAAGGSWWYFYGRHDAPAPVGDQANADNNPSAGGGTSHPAGGGGTETGGSGQSGTNGGSGATKPPPPSNEEKTQAVAFCKTGLELLEKNKPFEARKYLSLALLSGHLPLAVEDQAIKVLTHLANRYVLSPRVDKGDEYAGQYVMTSDDSKGLALLAKKLKLQVPWQCMLLVSDGALSDLVHQNKAVDMALLDRKARRVNVGQGLKTLSGSFHAVISKSRHIMDLYLHRPGGDKVFVRRIPVALGGHGCTPTGLWEVADRMVRPPYNTAENSPLRKFAGAKGYIAYGEPHYAFGPKGLWIPLRGISDNTKVRKGYGIHSTDDQASIGTDASEGCIRVGDNDIELVFCLLYQTKKGSATRASTVEIRD